MSTSFSLSLELILLMNWLLENDKTKLKALIQETIKQGLYEELELSEEYQDKLNDTNFLHNTVSDFLLYLEDVLLECLEKNDVDNNCKEKLRPTLQKINNQAIDFKTVWLSINQAKAKHTPKQDIKKELFSQLIKNWKPKENEPVN